MGGAAPAAAWGWAPQGHGAPLQPPQGTPRPDFCTWVGIAASEVGCPSREAEGPASCSWSGLARPSEGCGTQEGGAQRTAMRPSARCGWRRPRHAGRRGHGPPRPCSALPSCTQCPLEPPSAGNPAENVERSRKLFRGAGGQARTHAPACRRGHRPCWRPGPATRPVPGLRTAVQSSLQRQPEGWPVLGPCPAPAPWRAAADQGWCVRCRLLRARGAVPAHVHTAGRPRQEPRRCEHRGTEMKPRGPGPADGRGRPPTWLQAAPPAWPRPRPSCVNATSTEWKSQLPPAEVWAHWHPRGQPGAVAGHVPRSPGPQRGPCCLSPPSVAPAAWRPCWHRPPLPLRQPNPGIPGPQSSLTWALSPAGLTRRILTPLLASGGGPRFPYSV